MGREMTRQRLGGERELTPALIEYAVAKLRKEAADLVLQADKWSAMRLKEARRLEAIKTQADVDRFVEKGLRSGFPLSKDYFCDDRRVCDFCGKKRHGGFCAPDLTGKRVYSCWDCTGKPAEKKARADAERVRAAAWLTHAIKKGLCPGCSRKPEEKSFKNKPRGVQKDTRWCGYCKKTRALYMFGDVSSWKLAYREKPARRKAEQQQRAK